MRSAAFCGKRRGRNDFVCPACKGAGRAALLSCCDRLNEFAAIVERQTSVTAGTVMHRSKLPLNSVVLGGALHGDALQRNVGAAVGG